MVAIGENEVNAAKFRPCGMRVWRAAAVVAEGTNGE